MWPTPGTWGGKLSRQLEIKQRFRAASLPVNPFSCCPPSLSHPWSCSTGVAALHAIANIHHCLVFRVLSLNFPHGILRCTIGIHKYWWMLGLWSQRSFLLSWVRSKNHQTDNFLKTCWKGERRINDWEDQERFRMPSFNMEVTGDY